MFVLGEYIENKSNYFYIHLIEKKEEEKKMTDDFFFWWKLLNYSCRETVVKDDRGWFSFSINRRRYAKYRLILYVWLRIEQTFGSINDKRDHSGKTKWQRGLRYLIKKYDKFNRIY